MNLDLVFTPGSSRSSKCQICGGSALSRERHLQRLHKDVEVMMHTSIDQRRLVNLARNAWTNTSSTSHKSVLKIDECFERTPMFLKCRLCRSGGIKEALGHLCKKHGNDFKVDGEAVKLGGFDLKLVDMKIAPQSLKIAPQSLKNFFSPQPAPKMLLRVKEEPVSPGKTPPAPVNRGNYEAIVIDSPEEATPPSRDTAKPKREKKKTTPPQPKSKRKENTTLVEEEESEEESILDSDMPISFTDFLCATDPVRGYYTIWHYDIWDEEWAKCETPEEFVALMKVKSDSDLVNAAIDCPPKGGVPGLVEISHKDLSKNGRMCLMRWSRHVEIRNGEPRSGEKEDAVEAWNRTVRVVKKRFANGEFRKRITGGKKRSHTKN